jgi:predicted  nucleic acid-binding Zn-ribbon protein
MTVLMHAVLFVIVLNLLDVRENFQINSSLGVAMNEYNQLYTKHVSLKDQLTTMRTELTTLNNRIGTNINELNILQQKAQSLSIRISSQEKAVTDAGIRLTFAQNTLNILNQQAGFFSFFRMTNPALAAARGEYIQLYTKNVSLKDELTRMRMELTTLRGAIITKGNDLNTLQQRAQSLPIDIRSQEKAVTDAGIRLTAAQNTLDALKKQALSPPPAPAPSLPIAGSSPSLITNIVANLMGSSRPIAGSSPSLNTIVTNLMGSSRPIAGSSPSLNTIVANLMGSSRPIAGSSPSLNTTEATIRTREERPFFIH